jgi:hypothetical protein
MTGNAILREQTLSEQVLSINEHLEELAAAEEWHQVSDLMTKRNAMLQVIEDVGQEAALVAARRTTDRIQRMAENARKDVADKLAQLQRGKVATDSYRAHA